MDDDFPQTALTTGTPAWIVTFADMMSLLMSFFVLLLAFSEMDLQKFKQVAGSMSQAFGVQRRVEASENASASGLGPFTLTPGKAVPTPLDLPGGLPPFETSLDTSTTNTTASPGQVDEALLKAQIAQLQSELQRETQQGVIDIEEVDGQIVIRIREKGSFGSGSAEMQRSFLPILNKISRKVSVLGGNVIVAGHTDDNPIATPQYPSNWVLSAARAAAVVNYMIEQGKLDPQRALIRAHADMQPLVPNSSEANRAKNRRVEIILANTLVASPPPQPLAADESPKPPDAEPAGDQ